LRFFPAVLLAAACGPRVVAPQPAPPAITIVVSEVGALGARLVVLDAHGDREADLLRAPTGRVRDTNPAISPDGKTIVFESSRDRDDGQTSLWIAPLVLDAVPERLTTGALDRQPAWAPDGRSIVFARKVAEHFNLYRLTLSDRQLEQLTRGDFDEVTPSIAPDGTIYYCAIDGGEARILRLDLDGTSGGVTGGPADTAPAVSPDGKWIALSRPIVHAGTPDGDLWLMPRDGDAATPLVELPISDESGPVWSADGRYVFATSAVRSIVDGRVLASSVIVVDMATRHARILQDRSGYIARLTPAIVPRPFDRVESAALAADPEYVPALARLLARAIAAHAQEQSP
jgi:Tol biopolymer transport system component